MTLRFHAAAVAAALTLAPALAQQPGPPQPAANPLDAVPEKQPFDIPYGAPITLERATAVIDAAQAEAAKRGWKMNIAVVDSGANLVAFRRMDGGLLASITISQKKAAAAARFRRDIKVFEAALQSGALGSLTLDGAVASRGGVPLVENGTIIGAIGVSGGTSSQDEVVARAGLAAVAR